MFIFFSFQLRGKRKRKRTKRKGKTRNCLLRTSCALIEWMYAGKAGTLSRPIVAYGNTVEVKMRTTTHHGRVSETNNSPCKSASSACYSHLNRARQSALNNCVFSFFFFVLFFFLLPRNQKEEEKVHKIPIFGILHQNTLLFVHLKKRKEILICKKQN